MALFEKNNEKLKAFLNEHQPDIVCMQEVTRKVGKNVDLEYISIDTIQASTPKLTESFFGPYWIVKDFRQTDFHGSQDFAVEYGDWLEFGLLTATHDLITDGRLEFVQGSIARRTDWSNWPEEDNRAVQVSDLAIHSDQPNLRLLNYHGLWSRGKEGNDRTIEANTKILKLAKEVDYPVIICGDFNLFPETPSMKLLSNELTSLVDTYSINTTRPRSNELSGMKRNVVDYVMVSKGIKVNIFSVPDGDVSDHLPLILDFELI